MQTICGFRGAARCRAIKKFFQSIKHAHAFSLLWRVLQLLRAIYSSSTLLSIKAVICRRCFLVGRPLPLGRKAVFSSVVLGRGGSWSIYRACASGAGPRRLPRATTSMVRIWSFKLKTKISPTRNCALARVCLVALMRKFPLPTNRVASVRVLKNRACHSHLSARIGAEAAGRPCCVIAIRQSLCCPYRLRIAIVKPQRVNSDLLAFVVSAAAQLRGFGYPAFCHSLEPVFCP